MLLSQRTALATAAQAIAETFCPATVQLPGDSAVACAATTPRSGHRVADDGSGITPTFRCYIRVLVSRLAVTPKCGMNITLTIAGTPRTLKIEEALKENNSVTWRIVAVAPTA